MYSLSIKIEAILYLKGKPLSLSEISEIARCDRGQIKDALIELMSEYAHRHTALEIVETDKGYSLQLKSTFTELIDSLIQPELGVGALRTLAAIAIKGGITQSQLVDIRGSGVYQHVPELVSLGLIRKRRQKESRSYWLKVTDKFHQYFQLDQLPQQLSLDLLSLSNSNENEEEESSF